MQHIYNDFRFILAPSGAIKGIGLEAGPMHLQRGQDPSADVQVWRRRGHRTWNGRGVERRYVPAQVVTVRVTSRTPGTSGSTLLTVEVIEERTARRQKKT